MAIIATAEENLVNLHGTRKIKMDELIDKAYDISSSFKKVRVDGLAAKPMYMDRDRRVVLARKGRAALHSDISEYAFGQMCTKIGVPSGYMKKLYDANMDELVDTNIRQVLAHDLEKGVSFEGYMAMESEGVVESIVSDRFADDYRTPQVLEDILKYMPENYEPNQFYMSKQRMHGRFIDFDNPVEVGGERLTVGFTVGTSDIGKSSLNVKFFLYKFSCRNGIVRVRNGGTIYQQRHIGTPFTDSNLEEFRRAFSDITLLRDNALNEVARAQNRMMSRGEMENILATCRKHNISLSDEKVDNIIDLAAAKYGRTQWGVINALTEEAQKYTLDTRLNYEVWADDLLRKAM